MCVLCIFLVWVSVLFRCVLRLCCGEWWCPAVGNKGAAARLGGGETGAPMCVRSAAATVMRPQQQRPACASKSCAGVTSIVVLLGVLCQREGMSCLQSCVLYCMKRICFVWCGTTVPSTRCASSTPLTTPVWHHPSRPPTSMWVSEAELRLSVPPVISQCCVASVHVACVALVVWSSLFCACVACVPDLLWCCVASVHVVLPSSCGAACFVPASRVGMTDMSVCLVRRPFPGVTPELCITALV